MNKAAEFDQRMKEIYQRAKTEAGYNATRYLEMLAEHGGIETARILLASSDVSDGYTALWERKRLDLTVEALVIGEDWGLFTLDEIDAARRRLAQNGYFQS